MFLLFSTVFIFFKQESKMTERLEKKKEEKDALGLKFKLFQPDKTHWLSHERSLTVV